MACSKTYCGLQRTFGYEQPGPLSAHSGNRGPGGVGGEGEEVQRGSMGGEKRLDTRVRAGTPCLVASS